MFGLTLLSHHLYVLCLLQCLNGGQNCKNKTKVGIKSFFPLGAKMHEENLKLCPNMVCIPVRECCLYWAHSTCTFALSFLLNRFPAHTNGNKISGLCDIFDFIGPNGSKNNHIKLVWNYIHCFSDFFVYAHSATFSDTENENFMN